MLGLTDVGWVGAGAYFGGLDVSIGPGTFVNFDCTFDNSAGIRIGQDCLLSMGVLIVTSTHEVAADGGYSTTVGKAVSIGDRCWIGARATILPGVEICDDVVIGAGAVVVSSLSRPGVYVGVPARFLREANPFSLTFRAPAR